MRSQTDKAMAFRALHERPGAFIIPNPWDIGTARLLAALGFEALATTSLGLANMLGRADSRVARSEVLANCRDIAAATDLPVNVDLENCFAHAPEAAAETIRLAAEVGALGGSIEDFTGDSKDPIYDFDLAVARVRAAAEVAHGLAVPFLLTARAENLLHGRNDLSDTTRRVQAYEAAGADVLYVPGLRDLGGGAPRGRGGETASQCRHRMARPGHHGGSARRSRRQAYQLGRRAVAPRVRGAVGRRARHAGGGVVCMDARDGVDKRDTADVCRWLMEGYVECGCWRVLEA